MIPKRQWKIVPLSTLHDKMEFFFVQYVEYGRPVNWGSLWSVSRLRGSWKPHGKLGSNMCDNRNTTKVWILFFSLLNILSIYCIFSDLAVSFSLRANSHTTVLAFRSWHKVHVTHQNANSFAVEHHSALLRYTMLLSWRLKLRDKINLTKMARRADSYFAARRAYKIWREAFESRVREKTLKNLEQRQVARIFQSMLNSAALFTISDVLDRVVGSGTPWQE